MHLPHRHNKLREGVSDPEPQTASRATPTQSDLGPPSSQVQLTQDTTQPQERLQTQPLTSSLEVCPPWAHIGVKVSHQKISKRSYPHSCALSAAYSLTDMVSSHGGKRPAKSSCSAYGRVKARRAICIFILWLSTQCRLISFIFISYVRPHIRSTW